VIDNKIGILGAGSWATALAIHLARNGYQPVMWSRREDLALEINTEHSNHRYLTDVIIPGSVYSSTDLEYVANLSDVLLVVVPSHAFRETIRKILPLAKKNAVLVNAAKGIEQDSLKRLSQVFCEEAGEELAHRYVMLSGPSHAEEVGRAMPTAVVVASESSKSAEKARDVLISEHLRVYTNTDVIGVELGGALKNIIALGTGIADGLGFGDNTKAALMTRGLAEITRLGIKMGANPLTFAGLAGVGDLIVTCTSMHSRNRRAGMEIGRGKTLDEALDSVHMVVEGVRTTRAANRIALLQNVEMPITSQMYQVLFEGQSPRQAVCNLMGRGPKNEMEAIDLP
jgi:glycerol-3-phosphate dehydrogenase (NAD(P)+)